MKLSAPKNITFWIAVALAVIGVLATLLPIAALSAYAFWIVVIAFLILALGNMVKDM